MSEYETVYGGIPCQTGGMHIFATPERCVCGAKEGYILVPRFEYNRLVEFARTAGYETSEAAASSARVREE